MKLFENRKDFPYLRWAEGFCIGLILTAAAAASIPTKEPEVKIVKVPVTKVIEKEVVVNKCVYLLFLLFQIIYIYNFMIIYH